MDTRNIFISLERPASPEGLVQGILQKIDKEELFRLRRNTAFFSMCAVVCFGVLVESVRMTALQLSQSGFIIFLSSLFSDSDIVIANGWSYLFVLLESFPFFYASVTLGIVLVLSIVIPIFWRDIRMLKKISFTHSVHTV